MNAAARIVFARQRLPADLAAGAFTALVLYAEYIGLGVVLGGALPSSSGVSLGITMVVGAVLVNCVLGLLLRQPLLAGPRTGSLAVLVAGMKFSTDQAQEGADRMAIALAALSVMLLVSSAVQLAGLLPRVRAWLCCTSLAWRKGFVFSTAVSIVVGLGTAQLNGCLRVSLGWTTLVVIVSMVAAIGWSRGCTRSRSPAWVRSLAPFSTVIGVALASAGYYALVAPAAAGGWCDVVGVTSATGEALQQPGLSPSTFVAAGMSLPAWAWPAIALWGALLGLVLLFESLTSLSESRADTPPPHWAAHLKLRAAANLVCGLLGLGCSSLSLSRTNALIESSARTALALAAHGIALLVCCCFCRNGSARCRSWRWRSHCCCWRSR